MNTRIITAALLVALASAGVAHAQVAPSYNADGICAVYALTVDPRSCEDNFDPVVYPCRGSRAGMAFSSSTFARWRNSAENRMWAFVMPHLSY